MSSKHSPAPWIVDGDRVLAACGRGHASVFSGVRPDQEREANSFLVAAAPDLLEALAGSKVALEECANILRASFPYLADNVIGSHLKIVNAAIAKATGGQS